MCVLQAKAGALIVSHDPHFLSAVSTDVLAFDAAALVHTSGPYEAYLGRIEQVCTCMHPYLP